ncbi:MAG TPA: methyltransferase domain-containing protein [Acidimicrobiia bacterium]|jgi:SAM-dependent methyltransferase|nr:methyltransferase domain-containing protein [Acidimicrobiia bacterium]
MCASDHDSVVRSSFEKQAAIFGGEHSPFARRPHSPLAWLEPLEPDMIVLDVACGAAHVAEQAAPHVRQVVGLDLTPSLLEVGADRLREAGITNVLLQEGNAAELPFLDASFDLVVCRGAMHHFLDPERPVAEMARVCRPEGRVVVSDMVATSAEARERFDQVHRNLDPSHARTLLEPEVAELLRSTVGPIAYGETSDPFAIPVDHILTAAADREAVMSALRADLAGGDATGFDPVLDGDQILVSFTSTVVHATRSSA